jgi:hypothetical protein
MRILATTRPPVTVLPNSLRTCVVVLMGTSVPSRGCKESVLASWSVASESESVSSWVFIGVGMEEERSYLRCS